MASSARSRNGVRVPGIYAAMLEAEREKYNRRGEIVVRGERERDLSITLTKEAYTTIGL